MIKVFTDTDLKNHADLRVEAGTTGMYAGKKQFQYKTASGEFQCGGNVGHIREDGSDKGLTEFVGGTGITTLDGDGDDRDLHLVGRSGSTRLRGGSGDDLLASTGRTVYTGGGGDDTFDVADTDKNPWITDRQAGESVA